MSRLAQRMEGLHLGPWDVAGNAGLGVRLVGIGAVPWLLGVLMDATWPNVWSPDSPILDLVPSLMTVAGAASLVLVPLGLIALALAAVTGACWWLKRGRVAS